MGLLRVNPKMIISLSQLQQRELEWMTWTPARAPVPRRAPSWRWPALTAAGFYVSQGRAGGLSSSCRLMRAKSHSLCASAWAATGYPVTWDAIGRTPVSHAMNGCAPGVRTGGGTSEKHMVRMFCTSAYSRRVSRSFCWAPHDAILYE